MKFTLIMLSRVFSNFTFNMSEQCDKSLRSEIGKHNLNNANLNFIY